MKSMRRNWAGALCALAAALPMVPAGADAGNPGGDGVEELPALGTNPQTDSNPLQDPAPAQPAQEVSREADALRSGEVPASLDIGTAVALTLARHPEIARANAALARGRADLGAAKAAWLPRLSYQANLGPQMFSGTNTSGVNENMAGPSLYLQQQVWDFGRTRNEVSAAKYTTGERWYQREAMADQLAEQAALSFLQVRRFELLLVAARQQVEDLSHLRKLIGYRVNAGVSDKSDLMLADVRVESARADAIQAETSMAMAEASLANLTGGMAERYADPSARISRFEPVDEAPDYDSLPAVVAAQQAADAARSKKQQAKSERYPRLGLQLGYTRNNYTYNTRDNAVTAVVTVSGDLFRPAQHYEVEAAGEDQRAAEAARDVAVIEARGRAMTAQQEIRAGRMRIDTYARQEEQAVTASRIFFEEYKLGKRTLTELLNTQLEIYRASSARILAEYDIMEARVRFENLCGTLRPSLGLPARLAQDGDMQ